MRASKSNRFRRALSRRRFLDTTAVWDITLVVHDARRARDARVTTGSENAR